MWEIQKRNEDFTMDNAFPKLKRKTTKGAAITRISMLTSAMAVLYRDIPCFYGLFFFRS